MSEKGEILVVKNLGYLKVAQSAKDWLKENYDIHSTNMLPNRPEFDFDVDDEYLTFEYKFKLDNIETVKNHMEELAELEENKKDEIEEE